MLAFSFNSCDEEDSLLGGPSDEDMQPVVDNMNAEKGVMSASSYMNPYGLDEELSTKEFMEGEVEYSWISIEDFSVRIDFSNVSDMGGAIIVDYDSNPLEFPFSSISATIVLEDYMQDGITYNGELTFLMEVGSDITITVASAEGSQITMDHGSVQSTWMGTRTMVWLEGFDTTDDLDDIYQISGTSTGVTSTATNYFSQIITPIMLSPGCDYMMYGSQEIVNNYGSDNETSLTMMYNVDSSGDELSDPTCNSYFKLHFVSGLLDLTMVLNMDEM